jgi:hypothetical protein
MVPCLAEGGSPPGLKQSYVKMAFDDTALGDAIAKLVALNRKESERNGTSAADVAVLTSPVSCYYRKLDRVCGNLFVEGLRQFVLPELGAPFDDFLLEDFEQIPREYRVYIFLDTTYVPRALRRKIREHIEESGATALWFYAPGLVDEHGSSIANCSELTGIQLDLSYQEAVLDVRLDSRRHPYLMGLTEGQTFGGSVDPASLPAGRDWPADDAAAHSMSPIVSAVDEGAIVLGRLTCNGQPGLVAKELTAGKSVYCGAPLPPADLLRNICAEAGVHIYSPSGDLVYANGGFVAVRAKAEGSRAIMLPRSADVVDAWTGHSLGKDVDRLELDMRQGEVALLHVEAMD